MAAAGLFGTPIGGIFLDWTMSKRRTAVTEGGGGEDEDMSGFLSAAVLSGQMNSIGVVMVLLCVFTEPKALFFVFFAIAGTFLFASTAAMNLCVLESVPPENRASAIAFSTLLMHLFGDVPSPIVVGWLKGLVAPHCTPKATDDGDDNDEVSIPDGCDDEQTQLRGVMAFIGVWVLLSPVCYAVATLLAKRKVTVWPWAKAA